MCFCSLRLSGSCGSWSCSGPCRIVLPHYEPNTCLVFWRSRIEGAAPAAGVRVHDSQYMFK